MHPGFKNPHVLADEFIFPIAGHTTNGRVNGFDHTAGVGDYQPLLAFIKDGGRLTQSQFIGFTLGDIGHDTDHMCRVALCAFLIITDGFQPSYFAIRRHGSEFHMP